MTDTAMSFDVTHDEKFCVGCLSGDHPRPSLLVKWHCKGICAEEWLGPAETHDPQWYEAIGCKCPPGSEPDFGWTDT